MAYNLNVSHDLLFEKLHVDLWLFSLKTFLFLAVLIFHLIVVLRDFPSFLLEIPELTLAKRLLFYNFFVALGFKLTLKGT